jgi:hypothetical protein
MKEKILTKIREKIGKTSLSERTLSQKAERLAKKVLKDEDLTDELIADAVGDLKDIEGQLNHDVAEKVKDVEKRYAERQTDPGGGTQGAGTDAPAWALELQKIVNEKVKVLDDFAKLKQSIESEREANHLKDFKKELKEVMMAKGVDDEYVLDVVLGRIQKVDDGGVEGAIEGAWKAYDADYRLAHKEGASPRSGGGSVGGGGNESGFKDFFAEKKAERDSEMGINKS